MREINEHIDQRFLCGSEVDLFSFHQSSIREHSCVDYTTQKIEVWAGASFDLEKWLKQIRELKPFVAEINGVIVAYADLQLDGYIDHFFVASKCPQQGLGSLLMRHIIENAIAKKITALTPDVSMSAQNFFSSFGFVVVEKRSRKKHGLTLPNVLMSCEISTLKDMFSSDL